MKKTDDWADYLTAIAKKRAANKGLPFSITPEHVRELASKQAFKCALSGIPFDFCDLRREREFRRPFFPSLDRIDNRGGYTIGNVRVLCVGVNFALNEWGEDTLRLMAKGVLGLLGEAGAKFAMNKSRKMLPGVKFKKGARNRPFEARCSNVALGCYETEREAHHAYLLAKSRKSAGLPLRGSSGYVCEEIQQVASQGQA